MLLVLQYALDLKSAREKDRQLVSDLRQQLVRAHNTAAAAPDAEEVKEKLEAHVESEKERGSWPMDVGSNARCANLMSSCWSPRRLSLLISRQIRLLTAEVAELSSARTLAESSSRLLQQNLSLMTDRNRQNESRVAELQADNARLQEAMQAAGLEINQLREAMQNNANAAAAEQRRQQQQQQQQRFPPPPMPPSQPQPQPPAQPLPPPSHPYSTAAPYSLPPPPLPPQAASRGYQYPPQQSVPPTTAPFLPNPASLPPPPRPMPAHAQQQQLPPPPQPPQQVHAPHVAAPSIGSSDHALLHSKYSSLKSEFNALIERHESLKADFRALETALDASKATARHAEEARGSGQAKLRELEIVLERERRSHHESHERAERELHSLRRDLRTLESDRDALQKESRTAARTADISSAQAEQIAYLREELATLQQSVARQAAIDLEANKARYQVALAIGHAQQDKFVDDANDVYADLALEEEGTKEEEATVTGTPKDDQARIKCELHTTSADLDAPPSSTNAATTDAAPLAHAPHDDPEEGEVSE